MRLLSSWGKSHTKDMVAVSRLMVRAAPQRGGRGAPGRRSLFQTLTDTLEINMFSLTASSEDWFKSSPSSWLRWSKNAFNAFLKKVLLMIRTFIMTQQSVYWLFFFFFTMSGNKTRIEGSSPEAGIRTQNKTGVRSPACALASGSPMTSGQLPRFS